MKAIWKGVVLAESDDTVVVDLTNGATEQSSFHLDVNLLNVSGERVGGDRVFVNKMSYRLHDPNRGDVVVLHEIQGTSERDLIKRVIALPGETIDGMDVLEVHEKVGAAASSLYSDARAMLECIVDEDDVGAFGGCFGVTAGLFDEFGGDRVMAMITDRHGKIWAGTMRGGLSRIDPATGEVIRTYQGTERTEEILFVDGTLFVARGLVWSGPHNTCLGHA